MRKKAKGLAPKAMQKLISYNWPGNARELENTIEYAMAMTREDIITDNLILQTSSLSPEPLKPLKEAKAAFEKGYVVYLLEITRGNVSKAAELAGKYRADFYNLMKKYEVKPDTFKQSGSSDKN
jgi:two-component system response regulator GlrR